VLAAIVVPVELAAMVVPVELVPVAVVGLEDAPPLAAPPVPFPVEALDVEPPEPAVVDPVVPDDARVRFSLGNEHAAAIAAPESARAPRTMAVRDVFLIRTSLRSAALRPPAQGPR
jgi:hypothetical protein